MIHAIVFDFDGVLADSEPLHLRTYQEVLTPLGIPLSRDEYYSQYLGYDDEGMFLRIGETYGVDMSPARIAELIAEKSRVFDALIGSEDVLYPGAIACIDRLGAAFPLGIASGALKHEIRAILRRHDLEGRFRFIVAAGDTPQSKPAPDPYVRAAQLHGMTPGSCLAIEDSHWGIQSARDAGLATIAVPHTYEAGALGAADLVVPDLDSLNTDLIRTMARRP
jgi:beta-phosphoglucomutase